MLYPMSHHLQVVRSILRGLTKAQASSGLSVHICTTNRCPFSHTSMPVEAIRNYFDSNVKLKIFPAHFDSILFSFRMLIWFIFYIPRFDVVHIHGLYRFPASFSALISRLYKKPYLIRPHGSLDPYIHDRSTLNLLPLKRIYEKLLDFPNISNTSLIHFTSLDESSLCKEYNFPTPGSSFLMDLIGIDILNCPPKVGCAKARSQRTTYCAFFRSLTFPKGIRCLMPAFSCLAALS